MSEGSVIDVKISVSDCSFNRSAAVQNPKLHLSPRSGRIESLPGLGSNPDFAALEYFFLPNRHCFLDLFDGKAAGSKRGVAMRRRHGNDNAGFADLYRAQSMDNRHPA